VPVLIKQMLRLRQWKDDVSVIETASQTPSSKSRRSVVVRRCQSETDLVHQTVSNLKPFADHCNVCSKVTTFRYYFWVFVHLALPFLSSLSSSAFKKCVFEMLNIECVE